VSPIVHVTNNTRSFIHLPPIPGNGVWPTGIRLLPGLNRVPRAYLDALNAYATPVADAGGRPLTQDVDVQVPDGKGKAVTVREKQPVLRYPGRDSIERLKTRRIRLVGPRGSFMGAAVTVHADGEVDENTPEGPLPPETLPENETHAIKIVESCSDREILQRWLAEEPRQNVQSAIRLRLGAG